MERLENIWERFGFDESDTDKIYSRCVEIATQLERFGGLFNQFASHLSSQMNQRKNDMEFVEKTIIPVMNNIRVSGVCAYKLAQEGLLLLEILTIMVMTLKREYQKVGIKQNIDKLDMLIKFIDITEEFLIKALNSTEIYKTGDAKVIVEEICKRTKANNE